jgi:hypothetical protein
MEKHDEQFENFLHEFRPCRPRELPEIGFPACTSWHRLAAAAALTIAVGASIWLVSRKATPLHPGSDAPGIASRVNDAAGQPLQLFPLTRLALTNQVQLDAVLTKASRKLLPALRGNDSTLRVLAKE